MFMLNKLFESESESWLDHVLCSQDMPRKLETVRFRFRFRYFIQHKHV